MSKFHTHTHEAMKTIFTLRIVTEDEKLATNAGHACINLLDDIESKLSRYLEGSDVWQINHMQTGETLLLGNVCYDCLRIALDAYSQTGGLFDITLGRQIEHRKNEMEGPAPPLAGQLMVDPERPAIHCVEAGREIDLGGIGKGFALDRMKALAEDWGIGSALLSAGASTQLAFGPRPWKIDLVGDTVSRVIELQDQALSASGTGIQGSHIFSPRPEHLYPYKRIWLLDATAASADAWSTAAMLMTSEELRDLAQQSMEVFVERGSAIDCLP